MSLMTTAKGKCKGFQVTYHKVTEGKISLLILNFGPLRPLYLRQRAPVRIVEKDRSALGPVWTDWRRKNRLLPLRLEPQTVQTRSESLY
jgi:hypothetical protein